MSKHNCLCAIGNELVKEELFSKCHLRMFANGTQCGGSESLPEWCEEGV